MKSHKRDGYTVRLVGIGSDDPFAILDLVFGLLYLVFGALELRNLRNLGISVVQDLTYDRYGDFDEVGGWFVGVSCDSKLFELYDGSEGLKKWIVEVSNGARKSYITTSLNLHDSHHQKSSLSSTLHKNNHHQTQVQSYPETMHFPTSLILPLLLALGVTASPVDNVERDTNAALNVGWKEGPVGTIDQAALKDCVANFGSWSSEAYCGGAKWNRKLPPSQTHLPHKLRPL